MANTVMFALFLVNVRPVRVPKFQIVWLPVMFPPRVTPDPSMKERVFELLEETICTVKA